MTLRGLVEGHWADLFPGEPPDEKWALAKAGGGLAAGASVSFFVFSRGAAAPRFHLKVNRDGAGLSHIGQEFRTLRRLYDMLADLQPSVPEPLGLVETPGLIVMASRALPGAQANLVDFRAHDRPKIRAFLEAALAWQLRFQQVCRCGQVAIDERFADEVVSVPAEKAALRLAAGGARVMAMLDQLKARIRAARGAVIPLVWVHGDFNYYNILLEGGLSAVVDWEHGRSGGLPTDDITFLYLETGVGAWPVGSTEGVEAFLGLRPRFQWCAELFEAAVRRVSALHGIDKEIMKLLVPVSMLGMLARDYRGTEFPLRSVASLESALRFAGCGA